LLRRSLRSPWLVVTDGARGLIRAVRSCGLTPIINAVRVHRLRRVLAKLLTRPAVHGEIRAGYWAALEEA